MNYKLEWLAKTVLERKRWCTGYAWTFIQVSHHLWKLKAATFVFAHYIIRRETVAVKHLQPNIEVMRDVVKVVNYINTSALNPTLFRSLCEKIGPQCPVLCHALLCRGFLRGNIRQGVLSARNWYWNVFGRAETWLSWEIQRLFELHFFSFFNKTLTLWGWVLFKIAFHGTLAGLEDGWRISSLLIQPFMHDWRIDSSLPVNICYNNQIPEI